MASNTEMNALQKTLTIRVPVLTRYEEEMDYDRFCEEFMSPEEDEDSPTLNKRCRETWEALIELYEKDGYVELEEIDGGEQDGDVLNDYAEAEECFQTVVNDAIDDLKKTREYEAKRAEMNAIAKANAEKRRAEREQAQKDAEEFLQWKKERAEREALIAKIREVDEELKARPTAEGLKLAGLAWDAEKQVMVERMAELEQRVKELTFGL